MVERYLINILLTIDQAINAVLLGHPDESLSSRLGRTVGRERYFFVKPLRCLIDMCFFWDKELIQAEEGHPTMLRVKRHCELSVMDLEQANFELIDYELWSWTK